MTAVTRECRTRRMQSTAVIWERGTSYLTPVKLKNFFFKNS